MKKFPYFNLAELMRSLAMGLRLVQMELRILPSDPGFQDVDFVADWIAKLKNAHLFHDLKNMPEIQRRVYLKDLEELFEQLTH